MTVRTRTPRFGSNETSPSAARRRSASRIGVRLTRTAPTAAPGAAPSRGELAGDDRLLDHERDVVGLRGVVVTAALVGREREELDEPRRQSATCSKTSRRLACSAELARPSARARRRGEAAGAHPLPDLRAGDLGGRGVLHQVVDRRGAGPVQPRVEVPDADRTFVRRPSSVTSPPGTSKVEQVAGADGRRPRAAARAGSAARRGRRRTRARPGRGRGARPRCRRSRRRLALLVLRHLRERDLVHRGVAAGRDERGHAADRVRAAPVAGRRAARCRRA